MGIAPVPLNVDDAAFRGSLIMDGVLEVGGGFTHYNRWGESVVDGPGVQRTLAVASLPEDFVTVRMKPATGRFFWGRSADPFVNVKPPIKGARPDSEWTKYLTPVVEPKVRSRTLFTFMRGTQVHFVTATPGRRDLLVLVFDASWNSPGRYFVDTDVPMWLYKYEPDAPVDGEEQYDSQYGQTTETSSDPEAGADEPWVDSEEERGEPFSTENVALQFAVDRNGRVHFIDSQAPGTSLEFGYFDPPETPTMYGTTGAVTRVEAHTETASWSWATGDPSVGPHEPDSTYAATDDVAYWKFDRRWAWVDERQVPGVNLPVTPKEGWYSEARVRVTNADGKAVPMTNPWYEDASWPWGYTEPQYYPDYYVDQLVIVQPGAVATVKAFNVRPAEAVRNRLVDITKYEGIGGLKNRYWYEWQMEPTPEGLAGQKHPGVLKVPPAHDVSFANLMFVRFEATGWRIWVRKQGPLYEVYPDYEYTIAPTFDECGLIPYPVVPDKVLSLDPIHKRKSSDDIPGAIIGPVAVVDGKAVLFTLLPNLNEVATFDDYDLAAAYDGTADDVYRVQFYIRRAMYSLLQRHVRNDLVNNETLEYEPNDRKYLVKRVFPLDLPPLMLPLKVRSDTAKIVYDLHIPADTYLNLRTQPMTLTAGVSFGARNPIGGGRVKHTVVVNATLGPAVKYDDLIDDLRLDPSDDVIDGRLAWHDPDESALIATVVGESATGLPNLSASLLVDPVGVDAESVVGLPSLLASARTTSVSGLPGGSAGTPRLVVDGPVVMTPLGIPRPGRVGRPVLPMISVPGILSEGVIESPSFERVTSQRVTMSLAGISGGEVGDLGIEIRIRFAPAGVPGGIAGTPTLVADAVLVFDGIEPGVPGMPAVGGRATFVLSSIGPGGVGGLTMLGDAPMLLSGIDSGGMGDLFVDQQILFVPDGIPGGDVGLPTMDHGAVMVPGGVKSGSVGGVTLTADATLTLEGVAGSHLVLVPTVMLRAPGSMVTLAGIESTEDVGEPVMYTLLELMIPGIEGGAVGSIRLVLPSDLPLVNWRALDIVRRWDASVMPRWNVQTPVRRVE